MGLRLQRNISLSLSPLFFCIPVLFSTAGRHGAAAQAVMTRARFTGRRGVGWRFTAYNWFKCINTRGVTFIYFILFVPANAERLQAILLTIQTHTSLLLQPPSVTPGEQFPAIASWCGMFKHCSRPLQENSNFQVWYWTNSTEPTLFTAAESDQWNNLTHPPLAICLWPVAMAPSLTPLQRRNRSHPSERSQDDPYHGNLVPSSPVSGWARSCRCDWRQSRNIIRNRTTAYQRITARFFTGLNVFPLASLFNSHTVFFPQQELEWPHDKTRSLCCTVFFEKDQRECQK